MKDFYFMLGLAVFWNVSALLAAMVGMPHLIVMVWAGISIQFAVMSVGTILHNNLAHRQEAEKQSRWVQNSHGR